MNGWDQLNRLDTPAIKNGIWPSLSEKYAAGAEGTIKIVHSDAAWATGGGEVWRTIELPEIVQQAKVTEAVFVDLNGNVRQVLSLSELESLKFKQNLPGK